MAKRDEDKRVPLTVAAVVAALVLAVGLAACGGGGIEGGGEKESEQIKLEGKPTGSLTISNWPLYIDEGTVPAF
jgi:hypothetical protein